MVIHNALKNIINANQVLKQVQIAQRCRGLFFTFGLIQK
jgi:hypothetical protein